MTTSKTHHFEERRLGPYHGEETVVVSFRMPRWKKDFIDAKIERSGLVNSRSEGYEYAIEQTWLRDR